MIDEAIEIYVQVDGARLFAVAAGSGRALIFVHGALSTHAGVRAWAAPLASRLRLVTPDLRGSGRSHDRGPLSWDRLADDVAALARHLGIARAAVGGISFGAAVAVRVALRHPALVDALVLVHPAHGGAELGLSPAQSAAMRAMADAGGRALVDGMRALDPLIDTMPAALRERARAAFATYDPASVAATTAFAASGVQPFARAAELAAIGVPALVVPGIDETHPAEVARVIVDHLPRCTMRAIEIAELAAAIGAFLEER